MQENINILHSTIDNARFGISISGSVPSFSAHISQYVSTLTIIRRQSIETSASVSCYGTTPVKL